MCIKNNRNLIDVSNQIDEETIGSTLYQLAFNLIEKNPLMSATLKNNSLYFLLVLSITSYAGIGDRLASIFNRKPSEHSTVKYAKTDSIEVTQNHQNKNIEILVASLKKALSYVEKVADSGNTINEKNITVMAFNQIMKAVHACTNFSSEIYTTPIFLVIPVNDCDRKYTDMVIIEEVKGRSLCFLSQQHQWKGAVISRLNDIREKGSFDGALSSLSLETHHRILEGELLPEIVESADQLPEHLKIEALNSSIHKAYPNIFIDLTNGD